MIRVILLTLTRPFRFQTPAPGREYAAWVLSNDPTQTPGEREKIAADLVASGCRYAVCSGFECAEWDDAIDWAHLETSPDFDPPDETFVMTTWHDKEPLQDVAQFFVRHTTFDSFEPELFVIVAVGEGPDTAEAERMVRGLLGGRMGPGTTE